MPGPLVDVLDSFHCIMIQSDDIVWRSVSNVSISYSSLTLVRCVYRACHVLCGVQGCVGHQ